MAETKDLKPCIACAEEILNAALLCKFCKTDQRDKSFQSPLNLDSESILKATTSEDGSSTHSPSQNNQVSGLSEVPLAGKSLSQPLDSWSTSCLICGKTNPTTNKNCHNCGSSIRRNDTESPHNQSVSPHEKLNFSRKYFSAPMSINSNSQISRANQGQGNKALLWILVASAALIGWAISQVNLVPTNTFDPISPSPMIPFDQQTSLFEFSYEIGVQAGKSLKAQNTQLLFYYPEQECADSFSLYSLERDLDFDGFYSGCLKGWE